jgi:hypothetical protein
MRISIPGELSFSVKRKYGRQVGAAGMTTVHEENDEAA